MRVNNPSGYAFFFVHPIYYVRPSFSLSLLLIRSRNSDPGSHSRLFAPPSHFGSWLAFLSREVFRCFLPSSTRVELCSPTLLIGALTAVDPLLFLQINSKSYHGGQWRQITAGNSRAQSNYAIFGTYEILTSNCGKNRGRSRHIPARINRHMCKCGNVVFCFVFYFVCFDLLCFFSETW